MVDFRRPGHKYYRRQGKARQMSCLMCKYISYYSILQCNILYMIYIYIDEMQVSELCSSVSFMSVKLLVT